MTDKIKPLQQVREALEAVIETVKDSFYDTGSINDHRTEWVCPLCGSISRHEDECPVLLIDSALLTLQGKTIVDEGRLREVITEKCTDEIKDKIMDDFNKSANVRQAVDATLIYLTKEDSDE